MYEPIMTQLVICQGYHSFRCIRKYVVKNIRHNFMHLILSSILVPMTLITAGLILPENGGNIHHEKQTKSIMTKMIFMSAVNNKDGSQRVL